MATIALSARGAPVDTSPVNNIGYDLGTDGGLVVTDVKDTIAGATEPVNNLNDDFGYTIGSGSEGVQYILSGDSDGLGKALEIPGDHTGDFAIDAGDLFNNVIKSSGNTFNTFGESSTDFTAGASDTGKSALNALPLDYKTQETFGNIADTLGDGSGDVALDLTDSGVNLSDSAAKLSESVQGISTDSTADTQDLTQGLVSFGTKGDSKKFSTGIEHFLIDAPTDIGAVGKQLSSTIQSPATPLSHAGQDVGDIAKSTTYNLQKTI